MKTSAECAVKELKLSLKSDSKKTFTFDAAYTYLDSYFTQYDNFYLGLGNPYVPATYTQVHYDLTGNTVPRTSWHTLNLIGNYNIIRPNPFLSRTYGQIELLRR